MKQLVILSGKGGTGKTSVAAAMAHLSTEKPHSVKVVLADADVDAANLELVMVPRVLNRTGFWGGQLVEIDEYTCTGCGVCEQVCRFEAIFEKDGTYGVDPIACEGCATCLFACPNESVSVVDRIAGEWFHSETSYGPLFHAALFPGQENSGKLVTTIKQHAKLQALDNGFDLVIVDGPPGIGCPVISASSGADLALIVAEPSVAGVHDMRRILGTTEHFNLQAVVCINKSDLYAEGTTEIEAYCRKQDIPVVGLIPFDVNVTDAMVHGEPVTAYEPNGAASQALREIWDQVRLLLLEVPET
jgi:MinD superfamily P-loop ATPase